MVFGVPSCIFQRPTRRQECAAAVQEAGRKREEFDVSFDPAFAVKQATSLPALSRSRAAHSRSPYVYSSTRTQKILPPCGAGGFPGSAAPLSSMSAPRRITGGWLGPGYPAAPGRSSLVLLPSGPDTVRKDPPRRTRSSTLRGRCRPSMTHTSRQAFNPALADCGFRAPLPPRLARQIQWRREWDSNPRGGFAAYTISNRAPSTTRTSLHSRSTAGL